jgi:hypothetical protein
LLPGLPRSTGVAPTWSPAVMIVSLVVAVRA